MCQHKENDFVIPVLKTIKNCKEECTTEYVKRNVHAYIDLTEEDKKPYPSRNKYEPRYYQVVGNLISHRNATLFSYVNFVPIINSDGTTSVKRKFLLNEEGEKYIQTLINKVENKEEQKMVDDFTVKDQFDVKILDYALKNGLNKRPPTDSKMANTVIELSGYKCEYAISIGKRHSLFLGKDKNPFMEGHHLIPMKASKDFFPINLDRPSNIASICPGCHALLHYATKEEKAVVLKILYDNHIKQLKADGIYVSFEKLLEKYY